MGSGGAVTTSKPRVRLLPTKRVKLLTVVEQWKVRQRKLTPELLAEVVDALFQGLPIATVIDLVGISMDTWSRWQKQGKEFLETGKPLEHEPCGLFVIETRSAIARWKQKVVARSLDTETYKPSWARDMTMLERRDRDNWGSGNSRKENAQTDPDMRFL